MNPRPAIPYVSQFFILLGLVLGAFIVASFVMAGMVLSISGPDVNAMEKAMKDPANADTLKLIQLVASAIMFFLPALIFARIVNRKTITHLGFKTRFSWTQVALVIAIVFIGFYLSGALAELTNMIPISASWEKKFKAWEKAYSEQVMLMANMKTTGDYLFTLLVIGVAPAIFEEVLFRGALQQLLIKWTRVPLAGILITSILFSLVHYSYYGFLSRAALGIILGYLFYYSKSIWVPMIAHFFNNGFAVTMMYYMNRKGKLTTEALDEKFPVWYGVIALSLIVALLIIFRNESKKLGTFYLDNTAIESNDPFEEQLSFEAPKD